MGKMVCPTCGQGYSDELLYCLSDGTALVEERDDEVETVARPRIVIDPFAATSDQEFCPSCGTPNKAGSRFCKKCGQPLIDGPETVHVAPPPPAPVYPQPQAYQTEPPRRGYGGIIAAVIGGTGLVLLLAVVGIIVAWNWSSGTTVNVNTQTTPTPSPTPKTPSPTPTPEKTNSNAASGSRIGKTGTLTTDANIRESPDPNSPKVGTHYKGAKIKVLEVTEVPNDEGTTSIWYHVVVTSYGTSVDANNYGLDKDPGSLDEGWINSNPKVYDPATKKQVHKRTVNFDEP